MRVAVHFAADHPLAQDEGPAVVAYNLGRIEEGVHNAPVGHEPVPLGKFLADLIARAREEYPGADVVVERLVDNGDGTSRWIRADEFDTDVHQAVGPGNTINRALDARVTSESEG